jgi:hypothetical protein
MYVIATARSRPPRFVTVSRAVTTVAIPKYEWRSYGSTSHVQFERERIADAALVRRGRRGGNLARVQD